MKLFFRLLIILFFSSSVFAVEKINYTVTGRILNLSDEILFSNYYQINLQNGTYTTSAREKRNTENVQSLKLQAATNRTFEVKYRTVAKDKSASFLIIDSKNQIGALKTIDIDPANRRIELGDIRLGPLHRVSGTIKYPSTFEIDPKNGFVLQIGYDLEGGGLAAIGFGVVENDGKFSVLLPPQKYTFYLQARDINDNWLRTNEIIEVKDQDLAFEKPFAITSAWDEMIEQKASLASVLDEFEFASLSETEKQTIKDLMNKSDRQITILYFFAHYCTPCFGPNGVAKYFDIAAKSKHVSVIAVHSDSYAKQTGGPKSAKVMDEQMQTLPQWIKLKENFSKAKEHNPNVFLMWENEDIATKLKVNGYPATFVFQNGELHEVHMGGDFNVNKMLRNLN